MSTKDIKLCAVDEVTIRSDPEEWRRRYISVGHVKIDEAQAVLEEAWNKSVIRPYSLTAWGSKGEVIADFGSYPTLGSYISPGTPYYGYNFWISPEGDVYQSGYYAHGFVMVLLWLHGDADSRNYPRYPAGWVEISSDGYSADTWASGKNGDETIAITQRALDSLYDIVLLHEDRKWAKLLELYIKTYDIADRITNPTKAPKVLGHYTLCTKDCEETGQHVGEWETCDRCGSDIHVQLFDIWHPEWGNITVGAECFKDVMNYKFGKSHTKAIETQEAILKWYPKTGIDRIQALGLEPAATGAYRLKPVVYYETEWGKLASDPLYGFWPPVELPQGWSKSLVNAGLDLGLWYPIEGSRYDGLETRVAYILDRPE